MDNIFLVMLNEEVLLISVNNILLWLFVFLLVVCNNKCYDKVNISFI